MVVLACKRQDGGDPCFGLIALKGPADRLSLVVDAKHEFGGAVMVEVKKLLQDMHHSIGVTSSFNSTTL
jgi:hypothetical protein